jgi:hypothetical protein
MSTKQPTAESTAIDSKSALITPVRGGRKPSPLKVTTDSEASASDPALLEFLTANPMYTGDPPRRTELFDSKVQAAKVASEGNPVQISFVGHTQWKDFERSQRAPHTYMFHANTGVLEKWKDWSARSKRPANSTSAQQASTSGTGADPQTVGRDLTSKKSSSPATQSTDDDEDSKPASSGQDGTAWSQSGNWRKRV